LAAAAEETLFLKVHDAYTYTADGRELLPPRAARGAIYLLRNPLDVAVAYAHHSCCDLEAIISRMADEEYAMVANPGKLSNQVRQRLLSWSSHVRSWVEAPMPVKVLRYEDLKQQPLETFTEAARFAGLPDDPARVRQAVAFSDFQELQRQEQESGFKERPPNAESFFREDGWGAWRREMTPEQATRIIKDHGQVMRRFGYLTSEGEPVY